MLSTMLGDLLFLTLYLLPIVVALLRKKQNIGAVAVINVFLGWTFIGWIVALAMACGAMEGSAATQTVNVYAGPVNQPREQDGGPARPSSAQTTSTSPNGAVKQPVTAFPEYGERTV